MRPGVSQVMCTEWECCHACPHSTRRAGFAKPAFVTAVTPFPIYFSAMIKFYGYKKCSTCRKAEKALETSGVPYGFTDITETPPSKTELK